MSQMNLVKSESADDPDPVQPIEILKRSMPHIDRVGIHVKDDFIGSTASQFRDRMRPLLKGVEPIRFPWLTCILEFFSLFANLAIEKVTIFEHTIPGDFIHAVVVVTIGVFLVYRIKEWWKFHCVKDAIPNDIEDLINKICEDMLPGDQSKSRRKPHAKVPPWKLFVKRLLRI